MNCLQIATTIDERWLRDFSIHLPAVYDWPLPCLTFSCSTDKWIRDAWKPALSRVRKWIGAWRITIWRRSTEIACGSFVVGIIPAERPTAASLSSEVHNKSHPSHCSHDLSFQPSIYPPTFLSSASSHHLLAKTLDSQSKSICLSQHWNTSVFWYSHNICCRYSCESFPVHCSSRTSTSLSFCSTRYQAYVTLQH